MTEGFIYPVLDYDVVDGDTVKCVLDLGFGARMKMSVRIHGINTPEKRGSEKTAGLPVRDVLVRWLEGHELWAQSLGWGKYAGRCLGSVWWDSDDGEERMTVQDYILQHGLGKPYDGGSRDEFTQEELDMITATCKTLLEEVDKE